MAASATATKPAKVRTSKQPPQNSVWIRYHPWIEGVMAHISAWSIHLLVIGGAILWFTYLAYALGFARPPRSLPMEAVRLDLSGGGGNKEGTGTEKGGDHAPLKEGVQADKDNPGEKNNKVDSSDRPQLTEIEAKKIDETFTPDDARYIKQNGGSMQVFADLDKELHDKHDGINPSKGNGGTGTGGGTGVGAGTGKGTESGTGEGPKRKLNEREKRFLRWGITLYPVDTAPEMLHDLAVLGIVLGIPTGPRSIAIIDPAKKPYRQEEMDASVLKKLRYPIRNKLGSISPNDLMEAMGQPAPPNLPYLLAFIPIELEDEMAQAELDYLKVPEKHILRTEIEIDVPGAGGRKYDVRVVQQREK